MSAHQGVLFLGLTGIVVILAINAMGVVGAIGLLRLREWGRRLVEWATWAELAMLVFLIVGFLKMAIDVRVESFAPLGYSTVIFLVLGTPLVLAIRALRGQTVRYAVWARIKR